MAKTATLFIIAILLCNPIQAQIGDIIKEKIEDRALEKVDDKIDDAVDDVVDDVLNSIFGIGKTEESSEEGNEEETESIEEVNEMMNAMRKMAGGSADVEVRESFQFDKKIVWKIDSEDGKTMHMTQMMPNSGGYSCTETSGIVSIQDFEKNQIITITDENMATVMSLDIFTKALEKKAEESVEEVEERNVKVESTNQTKIIAGHNCKLVRFIQENGKVITEIWFAQDMDGLYKGGFTQYLSTLPANQNLEGISGFPMEIISFENGKLLMHMVVEEIAVVKLNYDMSQYEILDMSMFGNLMPNGK